MSRLYNHLLLTPEQLDRLEVVLVSPRNPLNIGAAARAMANFGFGASRWLRPMNPTGAKLARRSARQSCSTAPAKPPHWQKPWPNAPSSPAPEPAPIASPISPDFLLPDAAPVSRRGLGNEGRAALVFGPEKHGLTREDLSYCHALIEIPTDPRQPSMNLGQAVAVCLYELARPAPASHSGHSDGRRITVRSSFRFIRGPRPSWRPHRETMLAAGYSPRAMHPANRHDLRVVLRRLTPSSLDTRRMMGLFRRILYRLQHPPGSDPAPASIRRNFRHSDFNVACILLERRHEVEYIMRFHRHTLPSPSITAPGILAALVLCLGFIAGAQQPAAKPSQAPATHNGHTSHPATPAAKPISEDELRRRLQGKTVYLRGGYFASELRFDQFGRFVGSAPQLPYTLAWSKSTKFT